MDLSDSDLPLFRRLRYYKSTNSSKLCREKLSYSRCGEILKDCLKALGYDHEEYGVHSLRSDGATAAVQNNEQFQKGHWKCKDGGNPIQRKICVLQRLQVTARI